jgi:hypothetical protein
MMRVVSVNIRKPFTLLIEKFAGKFSGQSKNYSDKKIMNIIPPKNNITTQI